VSDGGHFDNLGLYELVRRRCRYIVIGDAEEDPTYSFGALGAAIRKVRADFGVEISIDPGPIKKAAGNGLSKVHCVVGTITYPEKDAGYVSPMCGSADTPGPNAQGWLLYCKTSLTGDEPEDVLQYQASHDVFPQEPTTDQFFSESQFESYRQLGLHVIRSVFENVKKRPNEKDERGMLEMFQDLCRKWYPAPTVVQGDFTQRYNELMHRLSDDRDLAPLAKQFFPWLPEVAGLITPDAERKTFFFCMELIQFVEDIYFELGMESRANRENPKYGGWLTVFQCWSQSQSIKDAWAKSRSTYNLLFQEFFDRLSS
jgi:hypothetical protein